MLTNIAPGLSVETQPLRVAGFSLGHTMTVIQLPAGQFLIHSPVAMNPRLGDEIEKLAGGPDRVHWIVAPSVMHDLYLGEWLARFPKAKLLHSPGMNLPNMDPARAQPLARESAHVFSGALELVPIDGMPKVNEFVFLHTPSRTLIVADLIFNLPPGRGLQKLFQKLNGIYGHSGPSRFFRSYISDPDAFRRSIAELLQKDFERVIVGHGSIIHAGGPTIMREAFKWLSQLT